MKVPFGNKIQLESTTMYTLSFNRCYDPLGRLIQILEAGEKHSSFFVYLMAYLLEGVQIDMSENKNLIKDGNPFCLCKNSVLFRFNLHLLQF